MAPRGFDKSVLLTGLPGLVAKLVACELLSWLPDTLLYCLVRETDAPAAKAFVGSLDASCQSRVVLLDGDPASMDYGLSAREFHEVVGRINQIYCLAQVNDPSAQPAAITRANVEGAIEALELARACKHLNSLVWLSSASVSGSRTGVVLEDDLMKGQSFRSPVEESLAHAERILRRSFGTLPVSVVRPTITVGHSRTGETDRFDGLYPLIFLLLNTPADMSLPLPSDGAATLSIVPVDFLARVIFEIGNRDSCAGRTFQLADPCPLPAAQVFEMIALAAGRPTPRGSIPSYVARAVLRAPGVERFARNPRTAIELLSTPVRYDDSNAGALLAEAGLVCPSFPSYVDQVVAYAQRCLRARRGPGTRPDEVEDSLS